jgi:penicillin V acylase-like amidase (Ntn superfamily)
MKPTTFFLSAAVLTAAAAAAAGAAEACSVVIWPDNGQAVVVGRNMDWEQPMPVDLWALPRGIARNGHAGKNSFRWVARYGSVVASDNAASDGLNEKGLSAHLLWLDESDYGRRDPLRPGLNVGMWAQYFLDNFATVADAVKAAQAPGFQVVGMSYQGHDATLHLALHDRSGDTAVIEYVGGQPKVYHGRELRVMTNSPTFDKQLDQLSQFQGFGGDKPLPGTTSAADRFARAAYYLQHLPKPADYRQAVAGVLSVMRNVSQPFSTSAPGRPEISATRWRTVSDLTNRIYFFESTTSPNIVWVQLDRINFGKGQPVKRVALKTNPDLVGDVTARLRPAGEFVLPGDDAAR